MSNVFTQVGGAIQHLGLIILPYSFWAYIIGRWLAHFWGHRFSNLVGGKALWYFIAGWLTFEGDEVNLVRVVGYICFIEFWDNFLNYRKNKLVQKGKYQFSKSL